MRRLAPTSPRVTDRPTRCEARPLDRLRVPGRLSPSPPHVTPYLTLATDRSPASLSLTVPLFLFSCVHHYHHLMSRPNAVAARGERASFTRASFVVSSQ